MSALNMLRSCVKSRTAARSALTAARTPFAARRHYAATASEGESSREAEPTPEPPKSDGTAELEAKLKAKEAEVVDITGRLRYLQADFLNLQRNAAREKEQTRDFAITRFATDLLETADVLALALKSVPAESLGALPPPSEADTPAPKTAQELLIELHNGVDLTQRQLLQTLFKYHVKPFDPTGDAFDPNKHEALYQAPIPGKEAGTVIDCQKIGYTIKDRVLRAAQVGVAQ